ncbi:MAG: hypothetical protein OXC19_23455 [Bryobacterales bacterium]|nr:hypothetical protein [Bryobacterales bacterium]
MPQRLSLRAQVPKVEFVKQVNVQSRGNAVAASEAQDVSGKVSHLPMYGKNERAGTGRPHLQVVEVGGNLV